MKLINNLIPLFLLLICVSVINASERASISATATVIPMLGVMPQNEQLSSLSISTQNGSSICIQSPKNSSLLIHIQNSENNLLSSDSIFPSLSKSLTPKNSVADIFTLRFSNQDLKENLKQIITIIPLDN